MIKPKLWLRFSIFILLMFFVFSSQLSNAQKITKPNVIAYSTGSGTPIHRFRIEEITHLIYSFAKLKGDSLHIKTARDSALIKEMVSLKKRNPNLKVMIAMGGWSACESCSEVFSRDSGRKTFAKTTKSILDYFKADGIDIDWEYPAVVGYPGHRYRPEDKQNFTLLVKELRKTIGRKAEISFAAGGTKNCIDSCFEWDKVMPLVNRVNLMSYDLVSGYAKLSGHHTPLFSTSQQQISTDYAINEILKLGVPASKIALGAAFYARVFQNTTEANQGLYQPTKFLKSVSSKDYQKAFDNGSGFKYFWDQEAKAPFYYNAALKQIASLDDAKSISIKTRYVIDRKLNGIMFWELKDDLPANGLLDVIAETIRSEELK
ncbi:glycoside hydrolase family 18 protein [Pedobacter sandarakinus]|uniref:glycoside hydrolase family 18 protein n=1 Tax=Pedobacter sandarakinus TaxID=353156 RepID=UPI002245A7EC|nr:glycosyl hydrolase family 18 protein [Pedobacter sandarakinus]MCX2573299.1 glycosyl hydrolase family 18 protein [Pedobacter sandarakinus]